MDKNSFTIAHEKIREVGIDHHLTGPTILKENLPSNTTNWMEVAQSLVKSEEIRGGLYPTMGKDDVENKE